MTDRTTMPKANKQAKPIILNADMTPCSTSMHRLISMILDNIDTHEQKHGLRQRRRRKVDQEVFALTVSTIICNLARMVVTGDDRGISISRSHRILGEKSRYRAPAINRQVPTVLDLLRSASIALLRQEDAQRNPFGHDQMTVVYPTDRLAKLVREYGIEFSDIGYRAPHETVVLKSGRHSYWETSKKSEYVDDAYTNDARTKMELINSFIAEADIEFDELYTDREYVDTNRRGLVRYFTNGSFTSGGRLFGGFWQDLKKHERRGIYIKGEPTVALDYGQIATRILYALAGAEPPAGDLYDIPGLTCLNGKSYRDGVKKVMNSLMFSKEPLSRKPKGSSNLLPKHLSIDVIISLIQEHHSKIIHLLGTEIGHYAQFIESCVMTDVICNLMDRDIVCLPIHDGIIVQERYKDVAKEVMHNVFRSKVGMECPVSIE